MHVQKNLQLHGVATWPRGGATMTIYQWLPFAGIEEETISTPHIWSSVDHYKTVCDNEVIYLTCSASNCWSVTWTSSAYVGTRTAIEFNQDHDRPGDGKLVSLPGGRSTLAQISKTESSLSSDLKIRVPNNVHRTNVICTNDLLEYDTKFFVLANGRYSDYVKSTK